MDLSHGVSDLIHTALSAPRWPTPSTLPCAFWKAWTSSLNNPPTLVLALTPDFPPRTRLLKQLSQVEVVLSPSEPGREVDVLAVPHCHFLLINASFFPDRSPSCLTCLSSDCASSRPVCCNYTLTSYSLFFRYQPSKTFIPGSLYLSPPLLLPSFLMTSEFMG